MALTGGLLAPCDRQLARSNCPSPQCNLPRSDLLVLILYSHGGFIRAQSINLGDFFLHIIKNLLWSARRRTDSLARPREGGPISVKSRRTTFETSTDSRCFVDNMLSAFHITSNNARELNSHKIISTFSLYSVQIDDNLFAVVEFWGVFI